MPFLLRTLGGLTLVGGPSGGLLAESRRKPLAVLAILAVVGERGVTRDKLAAYLWQDGEPDRVRGVLKQTFYSIKRDLGGAELFLGTADLRLNPEVVETDVQQFERAVADGKAEEAARLYRGPFLDGFHLSDAPAFEHWADQQRDRLGRLFASQIERLALGAIGQQNPRAAAEWWLRLTEFDPFDVRAVSGLLHACLQAGDRPRAIKYAERHMTMLRKELEITPDPDILRLVEQARARPSSSN